MQAMDNETQIERRFVASPIEVRKADEKKKVGGYAARFGSVYDLGWFTEEIAPGAFDGADTSDVVALFNHDPNLPLGRNTAGTLRLSVDADGLGYEIDLPDSPNGENVRVAIERGDVLQSSWGFTIEKDEWNMRGGKEHRTIKKVRRVVDVSPVTFPANPDTNVAKRSRDANAPHEEKQFSQTAQAQRSRKLRLASIDPC